jgi:deazaflavin-dependent oxidoreductase (nitroreductase family)
MWRPVGVLAIGGVAIVAAVGVTFVTGMRAKSPLVLDAVRRFNRSVTNRRVLRTAGSPGASASFIRHVGRTTGRSYATPVGAMATPGGFVIALPYGTRSDWLKNVLASGTATIVDRGSSHRVDRPRLVPTAEVASLLPPGELKMLRWFKVDQCLRLQVAAEQRSATDDGGSQAPVATREGS